MDFGFSISRPRAIDLDKNDLSISRNALKKMPEFQACIGCGGCTATCIRSCGAGTTKTPTTK